MLTLSSCFERYDRDDRHDNRGDHHDDQGEHHNDQGDHHDDKDKHSFMNGGTRWIASIA